MLGVMVQSICILNLHTQVLLHLSHISIQVIPYYGCSIDMKHEKISRLYTVGFALFLNTSFLQQKRERVNRLRQMFRKLTNYHNPFVV